MPAVPLIVEVGLAVGSAAVAASAASKQAATVKSVANYNAQVDIANAKQLQLDAAANVRKQRQDNQAYLSKIRVAYAASGILSGTGTPMQVLATTAGRQEQDIQQYWSSVNQKTDQEYGAAAEGIAEGDAEADVYHLQAAGDVIKGIGSIAGMFGPSASTTTSGLSLSSGFKFVGSDNAGNAGSLT